MSGFGTPGLYWISCRIWFLLNALSFLTFGPAIFGWLSPLPELDSPDSHWRLEAAAQFGALVLLGYIIFLSRWRVISPALLYSLVHFASLGGSAIWLRRREHLHGDRCGYVRLGGSPSDMGRLLVPILNAILCR